MTAPGRILIVDDEPNVRLVFRTTLESTGHELALAEDGGSALTWLQAERADLVLLDLQMPGLGGMEVLERLRAAGNDVPVIIITAHGSVPDAVAAMKLGAIDFLAKPITPDGLRKAVASVLDRLKPAADGGRSPARPDLETPFAAQLRRAKRALNGRQFDEAALFLRRAIDLDPRSAEAHNLMGVLHETRREFAESYASYKAALKADRGYGPAQNNMRRHYERRAFGRSDLALDVGEH